jgi:hypothetical protein
MLKEKPLRDCLTKIGLIIFALISGYASPIKQHAGMCPSQEPYTHLRFNNHPDNFRFVIIPDRTGGTRDAVFERALEKINLLELEFAVSVGDLIQGYDEDANQINAEWDKIEAVIARLEMPFFHLPGNHDINNKLSERIWRERFGKNILSFRLQAHIVSVS